MRNGLKELDELHSQLDELNEDFPDFWLLHELGELERQLNELVRIFPTIWTLYGLDELSGNSASRLGFSRFLEF